LEKSDYGGPFRESSPEGEKQEQDAGRLLNRLYVLGVAHFCAYKPLLK
jgi:hypothetical protein